MHIMKPGKLCLDLDVLNLFAKDEAQAFVLGILGKIAFLTNQIIPMTFFKEKYTFVFYKEQSF